MEGSSSGSIGASLGGSHARHLPHHDRSENITNINVNVDGDLNVNLSRENNFHHLQGRHGGGISRLGDDARQGAEDARNSILFAAGVGEGMHEAFKAIQREKLQSKIAEASEIDGEGKGRADVASGIAYGAFSEKRGVGQGAFEVIGKVYENEKDKGYIDCEWGRALGKDKDDKHAIEFKSKS